MNRAKKKASIFFVTGVTFVCIILFGEKYLLKQGQDTMKPAANIMQRIASTMQPPANRHFVAGKFGRNNMFAEEVKNFHSLVNATGIFLEKNIVTYSKFPDFILSDVRFAQHLSFMNDSKANPRGGGYWFWKPHLIAHHLAKIPTGDFLVYLDIDVPTEFWYMELLMETMVSRHANLACYEMYYKTREWTKRDVYEAFCPGVNINEDQTLQVSANVFYFRKSQGIVRFVNDWVNGMADFQMVNDDPSQSGPEVSVFIENRHDQSIVDALLACTYHYPGKTLFRWRPGDWNLYTYTIPDN